MIICPLISRVEFPLLKALLSNQRYINLHRLFRTTGVSQLRLTTECRKRSNKPTPGVRCRPRLYHKRLPKHPPQTPTRIFSSAVAPDNCVDNEKFDRSNAQADATPAQEVVLVKVSENTKQRLFRDGASNPPARKSEAKAILQRLRTLNPELSQAFDLKETALSGVPLRLLCSKDSGVTNTKDVPSYLAVSYCWRNADWSVASGFKTSAPWPISAVMAREVLKLRESDDEGIWVDIPCLDQTNNKEKNLGIGCMNVIFRSARRMVIVMEDVQLSEEEEALFLRYFHTSSPLLTYADNATALENEDELLSYLNLQPSKEEIRVLLTTFQKILSARWFSRAWCSHEFRVSPHWMETNPVILVFRSNGEALQIPLMALAWYDSLFWNHHPQNTPPDMAEFRLRQLLHYSPVQDTLEPAAASLFHQFLTSNAFECTVPSDRISITMNLCGLGLYFRGLPKATHTVKDCFWALITLSLAAGRTEGLSQAGKIFEFYRDNADNKTALSTDRPFRNELNIDDRKPPRLLDSITAVTQDFIKLDLMIIKGTPLPPSPEGLHIAKGIIDCGLSQKQDIPTELRPMIDHAIAQMEAIDPNLPSRWLLEAMACSLDCGLKWLIDFSSILEQQAQIKCWDLGNLPASNETYIPAALKLLSAHGLSKSNTPGFSEKYLQPVLQALTLLADDRFKTLIQKPSKLILSPSSVQALIGRTDTKHTLAVPVALDSSPFFEDRVWLLESQEPQRPELSPGSQFTNQYSHGGVEACPSSHMVVFNKQVSWRLAGTRSLVGCGKIVPDGKVIKLLKNQRVFW
ncbi:hypothetical protein AOQ84DRAFT_354210 [Glonium stellatum]|uniref:Heterokaryon incompatibility domain-containing protein n=1 Tax=Glonium stellatum TaxID=574774 RepID=A0A8E2JTI2_9PEZI|nr:hypothetical protein AOQ84DRAFT_354210 [Glonium stellatum]